MNPTRAPPLTPGQSQQQVRVSVTSPQKHIVDRDKDLDPLSQHDKESSQVEKVNQHGYSQAETLQVERVTIANHGNMYHSEAGGQGAWVMQRNSQEAGETDTFGQLPRKGNDHGWQFAQKVLLKVVVE